MVKERLLFRGCRSSFLLRCVTPSALVGRWHDSAFARDFLFSPSSATRNAPFPPIQEPLSLPQTARVVVLKDEDFAGRPGKRISVFLAVWNVHVNRSPAARHHHRSAISPRQILSRPCSNAPLSKNEQNVFTLKTETGEMVFKQIAGLIARRVVSWKKARRHCGSRRAHRSGTLWLSRRYLVAERSGDSRARRRPC